MYDEAGQLIDKYIHYTSGSDYQYNIRGWLTQIDSPGSFTEGDCFGMQLFYQNQASEGVACYNGNISSIIWGNDETDHTNLQYNFSYDQLNRLTDANFYDSTSYDAAYKYDKNGNLSNLTRYNGSGEEIDDLDYVYTGNKIYWINDAAPGAPSLEGYPGDGSYFTYDQSGNLTWEPVKDVSIDYNNLNLPEELNFGNDQKTLYFYLPDGTKLRKEVENNNGTLYKTDYCGSFVYETIGTTRTLKYILTPEGRIVMNSNGSVNYLEYHLKDHLGNVRVALKDDGTVLQEPTIFNETQLWGVCEPKVDVELIPMRNEIGNPFGMEMTGLSSTNTTNKNLYRYNGKELQEDYDLGWLDYGARYYEPALGTFHSIDLHAENYLAWTPYNYVGGNPIIRVDPIGMDWYSYIDDDGNEHYEYQDGSDEYIEIDGNKYSNIGSTMSINIFDDVYLNTFQNLSMYSYGESFNLRDKILNDDGAFLNYIKDGSDLSLQGRSELFKRYVGGEIGEHGGDVVKGIAALTGFVIAGGQILGVAPAIGDAALNGAVNAELYTGNISMLQNSTYAIGTVLNHTATGQWVAASMYALFPTGTQSGMSLKKDKEVITQWLKQCFDLRKHYKTEKK